MIPVSLTRDPYIHYFRLNCWVLKRLHFDLSLDISNNYDPTSSLVTLRIGWQIIHAHARHVILVFLSPPRSLSHIFYSILSSMYYTFNHLSLSHTRLLYLYAIYLSIRSLFYYTDVHTHFLRRLSTHSCKCNILFFCLQRYARPFTYFLHWYFVFENIIYLLLFVSLFLAHAHSHVFTLRSK